MTDHPISTGERCSIIGLGVTGTSFFLRRTH
jgi:hypothetical protein